MLGIVLDPRELDTRNSDVNRPFFCFVEGRIQRVARHAWDLLEYHVICIIQDVIYNNNNNNDTLFKYSDTEYKSIWKGGPWGYPYLGPLTKITI